MAPRAGYIQDRVMRKAFVILLLAIVSQSAGAAGLIFSDGFESYPVGTLSTSAWPIEGGKTAPSVVTSSSDGLQGVHGGSKMLRFNHARTTYDSVEKSTASLYTNEFFQRMWIRFDSNWAMSDGRSAGHFLRFYTDGTRDFPLSNASGTSVVWDCVVNSVSCGAVYTSMPSASSWHLFERYFNRSTGVYKTWLDNTIVNNASGISFGSWRPDNFYPMSNWGDSAADSTNYMYLDDVEFFSDLGTGSFTGSMLNGDIEVGGTGSPPVMQSISCNPTSIQAPAATTCTAVATNTPTSYTWTGQGTNCTYSGTTASVSLTCSYGGARTPCATATNAYGTSAQLCVTANSIVWRYVKPSGFGAN